LAGAAAGNLVLFAGGRNGTSPFSAVVDVFDTSTRSWLTPTNLSQPRYWLAGVAAGNIILFAGGETSSGEKQGDNSLLFYS
jgi:N-acetylneuraminic acid mutarotase